MGIAPKKFAAVTLAALLGTAAPAWAHDKEAHEAVAVPSESGQVETAAIPFPVEIGGSFDLIDQDGEAKSDEDFLGSYMLVFFGYGTCKGICPVGLGRMVEAVDLLGEEGARVQPILITVDPETDTPDALKKRVPELHPRLLGLTGTNDAVRAAAKAYRVDSKWVGKDLEGDPVINHGSYSYLMGPDGKFLTLFPPILSSETIAEKIRNYM